jgi:hypothetical protein
MASYNHKYNTLSENKSKDNIDYKIYINTKIKILKYDNTSLIGYLVNYNKTKYGNRTFSVKTNKNEIHTYHITDDVILNIDIIDENLKSLLNMRLAFRNKFNKHINNYIESFFFYNKLNLDNIIL